MYVFLCALMLGQPSPVPIPPQAPPMVDDTQIEEALASAWSASTRQGVPLVIFVGGEKRKIPGAVSVSVPSLNENDTPRILVIPDTRLRDVVFANPLPPAPVTKDSQILRVAGLETGKESPISRSEVSSTTRPFPEQRYQGLDPRSIPRKTTAQPEQDQ